MHKEELIKFWKLSASESGSRNFAKDSSTLRDGAFSHNLAHISGESDRIFMKSLSPMCPWTKNTNVNLEVIRIQCLYPDTDSEFSSADVCGLWLLVYIHYANTYLPVYNAGVHARQNHFGPVLMNLQWAPLTICYDIMCVLVVCREKDRVPLGHCNFVCWFLAVWLQFQ